MDIPVERCAGLDIGKADLKACLRLPRPSGRGYSSTVRTFRTTTPGLLELRDWLVDNRVSLVAMESTGVYWKPVFYLLEDAVECWLVNPQHIKNLPGRKSDVSDAAWIAQLAAQGLVRPSFVPPPPIRVLRDLTRYRATLVHERTREAQRIHAQLEDAGIKLSLAASDILGVSGRAMLARLIEAAQRPGPGARPVDPAELAELARGRLRAKRPLLVETLTGRFSRHHAVLVQMMLQRIAQLDAMITALDGEIEEAVAPFQGLIDRLDTIPGVGGRTAQVILAEIGTDMTRFPTADNLTSWAGLCPGMHESAGKRKGSATRHGDSWLAGALGDAAAAASRTHGTYLGERYHRLARRRGRRRALVALARTILEAAWHLLTQDRDYQDLGPDYYLRHTHNKEHRAKRLLAELHALGYTTLTLEPAGTP
jgi:transposase